MSETVKSEAEKARDTPSLVDRVYTHLLNRIIMGAIRYGEAISIKAVAAELSVSSMPVREAVKRLEFEGVVTIKPRSACRVASLRARRSSRSTRFARRWKGTRS